MKNLFQTKRAKIIMGGVAVALVLVFAILLLMHLEGGADNQSKDESSSIKEPTHADKLDEQSKQKDSGEKVFYIPKDDIYAFSMTDANGLILNFEKRKNEWVYVDDTSLDIDESRIDNVLNYLCDVSFTDVLEVDDGLQYGLGQDSPQFTLTDSSGNSTFIAIGDSCDNGTYFSLNQDFDKVYINSGKLAKVKQYSVEELIVL